MTKKTVLLASTVLFALTATASADHIDLKRFNRDTIGNHPADYCAHHRKAPVCRYWVFNEPMVGAMPAPVQYSPYFWREQYCESATACQRKDVTVKAGQVMTEILTVRANSVTVWEAPRAFKSVYVGNSAPSSKEYDLVEASTDDVLGDRRLVLTARQPRENLFGFGQAIVGRANISLYDEDGTEVATLIVEVTPTGEASTRVNVFRGRPFGGDDGGGFVRLECSGFECTPAFKEREADTVTQQNQNIKAVITHRQR